MIYAKFWYSLFRYNEPQKMKSLAQAVNYSNSDSACFMKAIILTGGMTGDFMQTPHNVHTVYDSSGVGGHEQWGSLPYHPQLFLQSLKVNNTAGIKGAEHGEQTPHWRVSICDSGVNGLKIFIMSPSLSIVSPASFPDLNCLNYTVWGIIETEITIVDMMTNMNKNHLTSYLRPSHEHDDQHKSYLIWAYSFFQRRWF